MEETAWALIGIGALGLSLVILWWILIWGAGPFALLLHSTTSFGITVFGHIEKISTRIWLLAALPGGIALILLCLSYWWESAQNLLLVGIGICVVFVIIGVIWAFLTPIPLPPFLMMGRRARKIIDEHSRQMQQASLPLHLQSARTYWPCVMGGGIGLFAFILIRTAAPFALSAFFVFLAVISFLFGIFTSLRPDILILDNETLTLKGVGGDFSLAWSRLSSIEVTQLSIILHGRPQQGKLREILPSRFLLSPETLGAVISKAQRESQNK